MSTVKFMNWKNVSFFIEFTISITCNFLSFSFYCPLNEEQKILNFQQPLY